MIRVRQPKEFTWDMVKALPRAWHFTSQGHDVTVVCKHKLKGLYGFAKTVKGSKRFNGRNDKTTYRHEGPPWIKENWTPPPLQAIYASQAPLLFERLGIKRDGRPFLVIQNKYSIEWGEEPRNFIGLDLLRDILQTLTPHFQIAYIRPGPDSPGLFQDNNDILPFKDHEMIAREFPDVILAKDFPEADFNQLQFCLESQADRHISVSGGNACVAAYFEGEVAILDKYVSPKQGGKLRGIWKTGSWLRLLSGAKIVGLHSDSDLLSYVGTWLPRKKQS